MEYERIHKVQTGIISPSKLRMKLIGPHHSRKKDGSNSNSSRTSPSKLDDSEFVKNSLLSDNGDLVEQVTMILTTGIFFPVPGLELASGEVSGEVVLNPNHGDQPAGLSSVEMSLPRENADAGRVRNHQFFRGDNNNGNSSAVHPMRMLEDENLDYDSNASSSSFEFHKGERSAHNPIARSYSRPIPYKWNDAEKWIMNRQSKKNTLHNQANRVPASNIVRVAPEYANYDHTPSHFARTEDTKRVDISQPASQTDFDKFSFVPAGIGQAASGDDALANTRSQSRNLVEMGQGGLSCTTDSSENKSAVPAIRSVCMRDMGTEMTPVASQEPSRTATPVGSSTPFRSPTSSLPSTPRGGAPASTPMELTTAEDSRPQVQDGRRELTDQEIKEKTRREIVSLGVQLGKMNIAAWASKDDQRKNNTTSAETKDSEELERIEFEKRAAAWEEAEKSKHAARFRREEIKIQVWESRQKAKLEAEMHRIEAEVEQMKAQAHAKMVKKMALARQRSEEKRIAAEAKKKRDAERTAAQSEYIRQTGRMPSAPFTCCGWMS